MQKFSNSSYWIDCIHRLFSSFCFILYLILVFNIVVVSFLFTIPWSELEHQQPPPIAETYKANPSSSVFRRPLLLTNPPLPSSSASIPMISKATASSTVASAAISRYGNIQASHWLPPTFSSTSSSTHVTSRFPPKIIYGTAWKKDSTAQLVEEAIRQGFLAIDTACQPKHYHEPGVGQALETLYQQGFIQRENIFLQTKFTSLNGQDLNKPIPYNPKASLRDQVWQSFEKSCENLKTNYLDSLVMHSPMPTIEETLIVWKTFEEIYKTTGRIVSLGLSNTYHLPVLQRIYEEAEIKPSFLQNRFYRESGYDIEIRAFCLKHNIFYQSFWTLTANPDIIRSSFIQGLSRKYQKTPEQIFFKFIQSQGIIPLSGTKNSQHMREDLDVAEKMVPLEEEEIKTINQLLRKNI